MFRASTKKKAIFMIAAGKNYNRKQTIRKRQRPAP
jgi:hypothetical protein